LAAEVFGELVVVRRRKRRRRKRRRRRRRRKRRRRRRRRGITFIHCSVFNWARNQRNSH